MAAAEVSAGSNGESRGQCRLKLPQQRSVQSQVARAEVSAGSNGQKIGQCKVKWSEQRSTGGDPVHFCDSLQNVLDCSLSILTNSHPKLLPPPNKRAPALLSSACNSAWLWILFRTFALTALDGYENVLWTIPRFGRLKADIGWHRALEEIVGTLIVAVCVH